MDALNQENEECNEQYSNDVLDISYTKKHAILDSEEHVSCSKKLKVRHTEDDIISKEVCLKLLFLSLLIIVIYTLL